MTALLELKQKIKSFYGQYEMYVLSVLKFAIALMYFVWINSRLGYLELMSNPFVVLILALLCAILPVNAILFFGYVLIVGHCYGIGLECAGIALALVILMMVLFLRFSKHENVVAIAMPLGFFVQVPAVVPMAAGLLSTPLAALPAVCGTFTFYFVENVRALAATLQNKETEALEKVHLILDGIIMNRGMWVAILAVAVTVMLVYLIRTRAFDYAWHVAIAVGAVAYILIVIAGSMFLKTQVSMVTVTIFTILAVLIGFVIEFFAFGGDYTRTERLEYEDDEYFYYVKAVPKAAVAASKRKVKKINAEPIQEKTEEPADTVVEYANPIFEGEPKVEEGQVQEAAEESEVQEADAVQPEAAVQEADENLEHTIDLADVSAVDFEKKLEESLKNL